MSKYFSKKVFCDGILFDSQREAERWTTLKNEQRQGTIAGLERQVKFELLPSQKIGEKVVERPITYIADFVYLRDGEYVVEDVKPRGKDGKIPAYYKSTSAWKDYVIKRKLMLFIKGIKIHEV